MVASAPGVQYAQLFYKDLEIFKDNCIKENKGDYEAVISLDKECKIVIQWWIDNIHTSFKPILLREPNLIIYTDSSKTGWGAVNKTHNVKTEGFWSQEERNKHINVLELKAALFALLSLVSKVINCHVRLYMDNTVAISYISNFGGKIPELHSLAKEIWMWCINRNIWLSVAHIPGKNNIEADLLSRQINDDTEWAVKPTVFEQIQNKMGHTNIDLFASRLNCKHDCYISYRPDPHAFAIDAFSVNWNDYNGYIFPPFSLLGRIIQKIKADKVDNVLLIAPLWPTQVWFPPLLHQVFQKPRILPLGSIYLPQDEKRKHTIKTMRLAAFRLSGNNSKVKEFQNTLLTYSCDRGEIQQANNMGVISTDGCYFQVKGKLIHFIHL